MVIEEPASYDDPEGPETQDPGPAIDLPPIVPAKEPELDPDLLTALGYGDPQYGDGIHLTLAKCWQPILDTGLSKDMKEKLVKSFLIPENGSLLQSSKLNAEISAAVPDIIRNRDKKIETVQQQLGTALTAVNKGLTVLLTGDDKVAAIKNLSDACCILSDLHFIETLTRIKLVTPALSKQFLTVIQDCERDDTLFSAKLSDKIKASKGNRKTRFSYQKASQEHNGYCWSINSSPRWLSPSGELASPLAVPVEQGGGRGGPRRPAPPQRRPAAAPQSRPAGQSKQLTPQQ